MKLLSEIPMDEYIIVDDADRGLMTKSDYLMSEEFLDKQDVPVYEASKTTPKMDWDYVVECFADENYEDWKHDVLYEIGKMPLLAEAMKILNKIFEDHPSYYAGNAIDNDLLILED